MPESSSDTRFNIEMIVNYCNEKLPLANASLSPEYYYNSLPFCLIDTVFSKGIRYSSARNAVIRYCDRFNLERIAFPLAHAHRSDDHTISDFLNNISPYVTSDYGATNIYHNKCRTSPRGGMLKAEAVYKTAEILRNHGIETIHDMNELMSSQDRLDELETDFRSVAGQGSGISFSYLLMLSGNDDRMSINRNLREFCEKATGIRNYTIDDARNDLMEAWRVLQEKYPTLTPRLLDHAIWNYESQQ